MQSLMMVTKIRAVILLLSLILVAWKQPAPADEITIAAASDLNFVLQELTAQFEKSTGNKVKLTFGSSGNFFAQIQNGAPYDLFFSADMEYPRRLEQQGLAESGGLYRYATGKIVLWALAESSLDVSRGLPALLDAGVRKIAIANPAHAPYGRAASDALHHEGLYDKVADKLVFGENISQTAQFVLTGNADAGIVALSLAVAPSMKAKGKFFLIPSDEYAPLEQAAVMVRSSQKKNTAREFLEFLRTPKSIAIMKQYGFSLPQDGNEHRGPLKKTPPSKKKKHEAANRQ